MNNDLERQQSTRTSLIVGGVIVAFGLILLLNLFARFIDMEQLLQWWPAVLVVIGLTLVSVEKGQTAIGAAMILGGASVLLSRLGLVTADIRQLIEIIVVLLIGLAFIVPYIQSKF